MAAMSAREAKLRFGQLLDRVAHGEEVVITKHDKPVARLVPEGAPRLAAARDAVAELRALQARLARRGPRRTLSHAEVKSAREDGRR